MTQLPKGTQDTYRAAPRSLEIRRAVLKFEIPMELNFLLYLSYKPQFLLVQFAKSSNVLFQC